jgi:hypothetical protein
MASVPLSGAPHPRFRSSCRRSWRSASFSPGGIRASSNFQSPSNRQSSARAPRARTAVAIAAFRRLPAHPGVTSRP